MRISIKRSGGPDKVTKLTEEWLERSRIVTERKLQTIGVKAVNEARQNGSFRDWTGNLRSSEGFILVSHGETGKPEGLQQVKDGEIGVATGSQYLHSLATQLASLNDYVLVVAAGMDYAQHVAKRRNVLQSACDLALKLAEKEFKQK